MIHLDTYTEVSNKQLAKSGHFQQLSLCTIILLLFSNLVLGGQGAVRSAPVGHVGLQTHSPQAIGGTRSGPSGRWVAAVDHSIHIQ